MFGPETNNEVEEKDASCRDPQCANPTLLYKLVVIFAQADIFASFAVRSPEIIGLLPKLMLRISETQFSFVTRNHISYCQCRHTQTSE